MSETKAACPICRAPTETDWRPFCSRRCADIDLGRWMNGSYALPTEEPADEEDLARALSERDED